MKKRKNLPGDRIERLESFASRNRYFYGLNYSPQVWKDWGMFKRLVNIYDWRKGPRVGDFLRVTHERWVRFTYEWFDNTIQTTPLEYANPGGSFSMGECALRDSNMRAAYISYSGSLDPSLSKDLLVQTSEEKLGDVWEFSNQFAGASRGVHCLVPFRVFELVKGHGIERIKKYGG